MLRHRYRMNELLEVSRMVQECINKTKGDTSFLDYYKNKSFVTEEEVVSKYNNLYQFYMNVFDETVDVLNSYEDMKPYFRLPSETEGCTFILGAIQQLHVISLEELTFHDFIYGCNYVLCSLGHDYDAVYNCTDEELSDNLQYFREMDNDFGKIFTEVNRSGLKDSEKIDLLKLYQNMETTFYMIKEIYGECHKILMRHLPMIEPYIEVLEKRFHSHDGSLVTIDKLDIANYVDFTSMECEEEIIWDLSISVIQPRSMSFVHSLDHRVTDQLVVGLLYYGLSDMRHEEVKRENLVLDQMKALADATRIKIIKSLSVRPYYTKELADETGLTAATVSHHMGTLLNAKLVILFTEGRKTYYRINKKEMDNISGFFHRLGGE